MSQEKKYYCRCCGQNDTHPFEKCKNVSEMRKLIKSHDNDLNQAMGRANRAEQEAKELPNLRNTARSFQRIALALVDLAEIHREGK